MLFPYIQLRPLGLALGLAMVLALASSAASADTSGTVEAARQEAHDLRQRGQRRQALERLAPLNTGSAVDLRALADRAEIEEELGQNAEQLWWQVISAFNDGRVADTDTDANWAVADAAWALDSFRDANDAFRTAVNAARRSSTQAGKLKEVPIQLDWARLLLEKYNEGAANACIEDALRLAPHDPDVLLAAATFAAERAFDFDKARELLDKVASVAPGRVEAKLVSAGLAIRDNRYRDAGTILDEAARIDAGRPELLTLKAVLAFFVGGPRAFAVAERARLLVVGRDADFYQAFSDYADWEHRYPELVTIMQAAKRSRPEEPAVRAVLGMNLLRMGDETAGLAELREAWRRDRYNERVRNTLDLYDNVIAKDYETVVVPPFRFRFHKDERAMLERYVPATLKRAYDDMKRRYKLTPAGPITIELYANPRDFALRTSGSPRIGVQGVCFGKVITAISPRGAALNWGQILWHELSHVFHIQLSKNRVPRWFTEGLAEWETIRARPEWKREDDRDMYEALVAGRLPPLSRFNDGFTQAEQRDDVLVAYYASSQIIVFIAEQFGDRVFAQMLKGWGRGLSTEDVFRKVLRKSVDEVDRMFRAHTMARFATVATELHIDPRAHGNPEAAVQAAEAAPHDARLLQDAAVSLYAAGRMHEAGAMAERAIVADQGSILGRWIRANVLLAKDTPGDAALAIAEFERLRSLQAHGFDLEIRWAKALQKTGDTQGALRHIAAALAINPDSQLAVEGQLQLARLTGNDILATQASLRLAQIDQHDRAAASAALALLVRKGEWTQARAIGESALLLDPHAFELHSGLAQAYAGLCKMEEARFEADSASIALRSGDNTEADRATAMALLQSLVVCPRHDSP